MCVCFAELAIKRSSLLHHGEPNLRQQSHDCTGATCIYVGAIIVTWSGKEKTSELDCTLE